MGVVVFLMILSIILLLMAINETLLALLHERLRTRQYGDATMAQPGIGTEPDDVALYQSGDDARLINWKVSAKLDRTVRNRYHADTDVCVVVLNDLTPNRRRCQQQIVAVYETIAAFVHQYHGEIVPIWYDWSARTIDYREMRDPSSYEIDDLIADLHDAQAALPRGIYRSSIHSMIAQQTIHQTR